MIANNHQPVCLMPNNEDYFSTKHLRTDLKGHAVRGARVALISQVCTFSIGMLGTVILARLLTPNDFGLLTMVLSISLLLQNISSNGFIEATIQKQTICHSQISTLFWINVGISFIMSLLLMASAPLIVWFYEEPLLEPIVRVMALSILFGGLASQHQALLSRNMKFKRRSASEVVATLISVSTAIILAYRGWGYWALVAKWIISPLVIMGSVWILCQWRPGFPVRATGVLSMVKYAIHTSASFAMTYFEKNIDKILIGRFLNSHILGSYDRSYQLSRMLPNQLMHPLSGIFISTFSRLSDNPKKYRLNVLKMLSILAFVCMPLSATLALVGKDVILLLLGPQWGTAGEIFTIFGPSIGVSMIYSSHVWLHLSLGTPARWFRWNLIANGVTIFLLLVGLPFGVFGIAVAYSVSPYILIVPALWYAGQPVGLKISFIVASLWRYYLSALTAGIFSWFILFSEGFISDAFGQLSVFYRIIISAVFCMSTYLVFIIAIFRSGRPILEFIYFFYPKR